MPVCEICAASVEDVRRHQRRSEYCQLTAVVKNIQTQGWKEALPVLPKEAPWPGQTVALWPDSRLASGPCDVRGGKGSRIRLIRGVLAWDEDRFASRLGRALNAYLKERILQDGGRLPFARKSLRVYGHPLRFQAETLWRCVADGRLDEMIDRYATGDAHTDWWNVPEYVADLRMECPHCGSRVKPEGLRAHQETLGCVGSRLKADHRAIIGCFEDPELQSHPFWDALHRMGIEVGFVRARFVRARLDRWRYYYAVTPKSKVSMIQTVKLFLEHNQAMRAQLANGWRRYAPSLGWSRSPVTEDLFHHRLVQRADLDVALSILPDLRPELVGVMAALS